MSFNYTKNSSLVGTGAITTNSAVHSLQTNLLYKTSGVLFDFFTNSAPVGISTYTSGVGTYSYAWSTIYGLQTAGDAGTGFVYTVQTTESFTGDKLIQTSFYYGGSDNCPDPSICVYSASNSRTSPVWNWGTSSTRIAVQNNCASSTQIYGFTNSATGSSFTYSTSNWYTMHFYHEPTLNRCRYAMTAGQNDWTRSNSLMTAEITLSSQSVSGAYYIGLASDADGYSLGANSCNFSGLRISPIG